MTAGSRPAALLNLYFYWSPITCTSIVFMASGIVVFFVLLFSPPIVWDLTNAACRPTAGGRAGGRYSPLQKKVCVGWATHLPIASSFFDKTPVTKTLRHVGVVHGIWKLSTFPALWRLTNYLRSTTKPDCLNGCLRIHCHKLITDTLVTAKTAKRFA